MRTKRSDRSAKLKDPLRVMACGHCQRLIDFMDSPAHAPAGTDPMLLHPLFLARPPSYSVLCTCGHYTFYVEEAQKAAFMAQSGIPAGNEAKPVKEPVPEPAKAPSP